METELDGSKPKEKSLLKNSADGIGLGDGGKRKADGQEGRGIL